MIRYKTVTNGGVQGTAWERQCPAGMALQELRGRAAAFIDRVRLVCKDLLVHDLVAPTVLSPVGPTSGPDYREFIELCPGRGAMVGLNGVAADPSKPNSNPEVLHRLGGFCEPMDYSPTLQKVVKPVLSWQKFHLLPDHGDFEGLTFKDECDSDEALVGLVIRSGSLIDGLQGICAEWDPWANHTTVVPYHFLSWRGIASLMRGMAAEPASQTRAPSRRANSADGSSSVAE